MQVNYKTSHFSQIQMTQQNKSNNKNYQKPSEPSIKLAFQANIFKYVQKKKRQLSIFVACNQKHSRRKHKHSSTSSNLIKQNTSLNFYRPPPKNTIDVAMLLSARIKLTDFKPQLKSQILKRKTKGHKYSLSDWRMLYDERDGIIQKREMVQNSPDKMAATDRLFYPGKNQCGSSVQKNCYRHNIKQKRERDEISLEKQDKFFVSDQNFFHMYHRSVTPIKSDYAEQKRIAKYLNLNKERREIGNGLRLKNEGIFSELAKNDVAFGPYKFQSSQICPKLQNMEENISSEVIKDHKNEYNVFQRISQRGQYDVSEVTRGSKTQVSKFLRIPKLLNQSIDRQKFDSGKRQRQEKDYDFSNFSPSKDIRQKNHINLSELFQNPEGSIKENKGQIRLRLFKPIKNKIESAISNTKKNQRQSKYANLQYHANLQYSIKLPQSRKASLNTTKHSNSKWTK